MASWGQISIKFEWKYNSFIQGIELQNVVCKMSVVLCRPHGVHYLSNIDGLMQDCSNPISNAMDLLH